MNDHTLQGADLGSIAFHPSPGEALSEGALVQYLADPLLLPSAQRHWSTGANGTIDPVTGRYLAGRAPQGTSNTVGCVLSLNGITLTDSLSVSLGAPGGEGAEEDKHWRALKSFVLKTPNFGASVPPWMFTNGRQQLHLQVDVSTEIGDEDPGALDPDELKTLALFELERHQPLAILNATQEPALSDKAIYWAVAKDRNTYDLANQQQPSRAEPDAGHLVNYYVHCLEPKDQQRTFYAGVRDRFGFWHYSDRVGAKSIVSIRPNEHKPEVTVEQKKISGFKPSAPNTYPYDFSFNTVEYWIFRLKSGKILSYTIKNEPRTLIQWEENAELVTYVSYTGIIKGGSGEKNVTFDIDTLKNSGDTKLYKFKDNHWTVPVEPIDDDAIAISNHRVYDVRHGTRGAAEKAQEPIELEIHDRYGNTLTLHVSFPTNRTSHRGAELTYIRKET